ncbi:hypothetical protein CCY99_06255 [Helicobacter sp. 16-1353]|uniref:YidC/Oxa1 family membrane protein insertase n=1 Tax=Helicobacter sp. 16-1353 TaxID=2004996 RepID=UPI000DCDDD43|nr:YidC/Oxa1 family membrane protein insertase [Helicobacter sp. 16-1353]RAX53190.1 hypothetical protein CCY99_06255 [Helicobacter sp. 16-1353]
MSEILFYIFIYPLYSIINSLLMGLGWAFGSYGLGIIALSLIINIFLFKLTQITNQKAANFYALKAKCDLKVREFKRIFKGAELQSYIRILYAQHHYHPIFALSALGGLLIQIPFFLAMWFLVEGVSFGNAANMSVEGAEFLKGASFLWISDLSKPDSLFGIHILPILMSVFSLFNVFLNSHDKGARAQGGIITVVFLIVLYNAPSALVLYWTTNMAFGVLWRLVSKVPLKSLFIKILGFPFAIIRAISPFFKHFPKLLLKPFFKPDLAKLSTYRTCGIFAILNIFFLIFLYSPFSLYSSDIRQFEASQLPIALSALFGYFALFSLLGIYIYSFFYRSNFLKIALYALNFTLILGIIYTFILVGDYGAMDRFILQKLPFVDPNYRFQKYLFALLSAFIAGILGLLMLRLVAVWKILFCVIFILNGINLFNIYSDSTLQDSAKVAQDFIDSIDSIDSKIAQDSTNPQDSQDSSTQADSNAPYTTELLSYSKTQKNIVVLVLDMFSGSHMPYLLEQFGFGEAFDGFTFFSNTLSPTNSTIHSMSTLISGEYYHPLNMNQRGQNLQDEITKAFGEMANNFANNGYLVSYFLTLPLSNWNNNDIAKYANESIFYVGDANAFNSYYTTKLNLKEEIANLREKNKHASIIQLYSYGLFRFSPELYFRPRIYNNGLWLLKMENLQNALASIAYTSSLYTFTHNGNTDSTKPTFKFLHSLMTHMPFGMYFDNTSSDDKNGEIGGNKYGKCVFFDERTAWEDTPKNAKIDFPSEVSATFYRQHYDTAACALSYVVDYIEWLKENGIYDNTQIFILSDHGGDAPISVKSTRADALLLFKDFNARGEMKVDSKLMANYDIASIFCENLPNGCKNVAPNILKNYPKNRSLIHTIPKSWILEEHKTNQWILNGAYKIQGNLYNPQSWEKLELENNMIKDSGLGDSAIGDSAIVGDKIKKGE